MKLIIGLGNPGSAYKDSRHNIGFSVAKALAKDCGIELKKDFGTYAICGKGHASGKLILIALPQAFMNLSGLSVKALLVKHKISPEDLLLICDDLDLGLGRIKLKPRGSAAGHRGMQSVIKELGSNNFSRLRIGIGRPSSKLAVTDFVLANFTRSEKPEVSDTIDNAKECVKFWVQEGVEKTMNRYNKEKS